MNWIFPITFESLASSCIRLSSASSGFPQHSFSTCRSNCFNSLSEVEEPDLHNFPNLAAFFYRTLKPGLRPLDPNTNAVLSPADGKIIQFGMIENGEVEQVKGVTYSLDALLGSQSPTPSNSGTSTPAELSTEAEDNVRHDEEFAQVNGISYTLPNLFGGTVGGKEQKQKKGKTIDQSTTSKSSSEAEVRADLALSEGSWWLPRSAKIPTTLYYCVVYLAPGDYHRFHSPVSWVVESRRHFAGELYSVSPYLQRTLPGLFTLNERVVLLGRWRWGFFAYTPVGATNVGSVVINFDKELRTNSLTTDTAADRAAEEAAKRGEQWSGFVEATYANASQVLHGHALKRGEEMGGFQLGSTIVLVFEAPKGRRVSSFDEGFRRKGGFEWKIEKGQKVKVGQALGEALDVD
jgi:phosphatidylserine decarboxylase